MEGPEPLGKHQRLNWECIPNKYQFSLQNLCKCLFSFSSIIFIIVSVNSTNIMGVKVETVFLAQKTDFIVLSKVKIEAEFTTGNIKP